MTADVVSQTVILSDLPRLEVGSLNSGPLFTGASRVRTDFFNALRARADIRVIAIKTAASKKLAATGQIPSSVEFFTPHELKNENIDGPCIIHSLHANLTKSQYIRYRFGRPTWPVVGMTHDLSHPEVFNALALAHSVGVLPGDAVFACSRAARVALRGLINKAESLTRSKPGILQTPLIPYGLSAAYGGRHDRQLARLHLKIPESTAVLLFFGRLSVLSKADLHGLITSFANLVDLGDVLLVLAGELSGGIDQVNLEQLKRHVFITSMQKRVRFIANPDEALKSEIFAASDVFVCPANSMQESFGVAVLEAMSFGLPVVVSDWNGYRDIVEHGQTGFLIRTEFARNVQEISTVAHFENEAERQRMLCSLVKIDFDQFESSVRWIITHREKARQLGINGRERLAKEFVWDAIIPRHIRAWKELCCLSAANVASVDSPDTFVNYGEVFSSHVRSKPEA